MTQPTKKPKTEGCMDIDDFIFDLSYILRDNYADIDVMMKKARKLVRSILQQQREEIVESCPIPDKKAVCNKCRWFVKNLEAWKLSARKEKE